jgi:uncharacterized protein (DUF302 family)
MTAFTASRPTAAVMPCPISLIATADNALRSAFQAIRKVAATRDGMERRADIMVRSSGARSCWDQPMS